MSKTAHVVDGEASESDSEIEIGRSPESDLANSKGFVITGEAPESDDESKLPSPQFPDDLDVPLHLPLSAQPQNSPPKMMSQSLLHQKLWECNIVLRAMLENFVKHTTDIAVEKLTRTDKMLLTVQESTRATNANMTLARARLKQVHEELEKVISANALATVKIKQ